jgi:hypothetical protein
VTDKINLLFTACSICLSSSTLSNTSSFLKQSVQLVFSILLQHHISKRFKCPSFSNIQTCAPNVIYFTSFIPSNLSLFLLTKSLLTSEQWAFTFVLLKHSDFSSIRLVLIVPHSTTKRAGAVVSLHTRGGQLDEHRELWFMKNFRQVPCLYSPSHTYGSNSSTWHNTARAALWSPLF